MAPWTRARGARLRRSGAIRCRPRGGAAVEGAWLAVLSSLSRVSGQARADRHLTDAPTEWLAAHILDTPDMLLKELRSVSVQFHPVGRLVSIHACPRGAILLVLAVTVVLVE